MRLLEVWGDVAEGHRLVAGRYRLTSLIGSGGMGRVWLARDEVLRREVAVKEVVLPAELTEAERDELCLRTLREARAAGRLSHPNVVQVYDVVQFEDRPWIVMELIRSRSLYQVIKQDGPVSPTRAAEIGLAVLAALRAAHAAGVWHRDVKPGNVLLAEDGRVVLTDFGLATFDGDGAVTRSGLILGSAQYIAPERARDGVSGPQSDLWSLGATLYAAVEGRSPYARESSIATLTALATAPPDPPRRAGPLRAVLIGLLRKNPRQRLTAEQAEKELRRVLAGEVKGRGRLLPARLAAASGGPEAAMLAAAESETRSAPRPAPLPRRDRPRSRTATEETYRVPPARRRWPWIAAGLALATAVPVGMVAFDGLLPAALPTTGVSATSAPAAYPGLNPAMQVQACLDAPAQLGRPVAGPTVAPNGIGTLPEWAVHLEPAGPPGPSFYLAAPTIWRTWTDATVTCLRDPDGAAAAAVIRQGARSGDPIDLLLADLPEWQAAAGITGYTQLELKDLRTPEGGAELQFTYVDGAQRMHGVVLSLRRNGLVYLVGWASPEYRWNSDRTLADAMLPTFDVAP